MTKPSDYYEPVPAKPPVGGAPVPDLAPNTLETLRHQLYMMADTRDAAKALQSFLDGIAKTLVADHPHTPTVSLSVRLHRGKDSMEDGLIKEGDWVQYEGGNERLSKQIKFVDGHSVLGRVVECGLSKFPRILWHDGKQWLKPYSLFWDSGIGLTNLHVLYDWQAAEMFPDAYQEYPVQQKGK